MSDAQRCGMCRLAKNVNILCSETQGEHQCRSSVQMLNELYTNPTGFCGGSTEGDGGGSLMVLGLKGHSPLTTAVLQLPPLPQTAAFTACFEFCPHTLYSLSSVKLTLL